MDNMNTNTKELCISDELRRNTIKTLKNLTKRGFNVFADSETDSVFFVYHKTNTNAIATVVIGSNMVLLENELVIELKAEKRSTYKRFYNYDETWLMEYEIARLVNLMNSISMMEDNETEEKEEFNPDEYIEYKMKAEY